jgi:classical protein kinase C
MEGDRKSRADAEGRRIESNQKIQLLKQALKRYEDLHVDMESTADAPDGRLPEPRFDTVEITG